MAPTFERRAAGPLDGDVEITEIIFMRDCSYPRCRIIYESFSLLRDERASMSDWRSSSIGERVTSSEVLALMIRWVDCKE